MNKLLALYSAAQQSGRNADGHGNGRAERRGCFLNDAQSVRHVLSKNGSRTRYEEVALRSKSNTGVIQARHGARRHLCFADALAEGTIWCIQRRCGHRVVRIGVLYRVLDMGNSG